MRGMWKSEGCEDWENEPIRTPSNSLGSSPDLALLSNSRQWSARSISNMTGRCKLHGKGADCTVSLTDLERPVSASWTSCSRPSTSNSHRNWRSSRTEPNHWSRSHFSAQLLM